MVLGDNNWTIEVAIRWIYQECREYDLWLGQGGDIDDPGPVRWKLPPTGAPS